MFCPYQFAIVVLLNDVFVVYFNTIYTKPSFIISGFSINQYEQHDYNGYIKLNIKA